MIVAVLDGVSLSFLSSPGVGVGLFPNIFSLPFAFSPILALPFRCRRWGGSRIDPLQRRWITVYAPLLEQFECHLVSKVGLSLWDPDQVWR